MGLLLTDFMFDNC